MLLWTPVLRDDQHRHMAVLVVGLNVFCLGVITEDVHAVNIEYSNCTYPFPTRLARVATYDIECLLEMYCNNLDENSVLKSHKCGEGLCLIIEGGSCVTYTVARGSGQTVLVDYFIASSTFFIVSLKLIYVRRITI